MVVGGIDNEPSNLLLLYFVIWHASFLSIIGGIIMNTEQLQDWMFGGGLFS